MRCARCLSVIKELELRQWLTGQYVCKSYYGTLANFEDVRMKNLGRRL